LRDSFVCVLCLILSAEMLSALPSVVLIKMHIMLLVIYLVSLSFLQEVQKRNPGAITEIREMKYIKEAAQ